MEELTRKYRRFIVDKYATIPCLDEGISLTMENYIPLRLGEEKKHERPKEKREEGVKEASDIDFRVWREEHSFGEIYSLTPVDVWRAIRNKKIVVKGDPGSGKTTLTRYIAYSLCRDRNKSCPNERATDLIPLVIDLKDWASKGGITLSEYSAKYALKNSGFEKTIKPLTEHWLKSGKCIILCDGLDEIAQKNKDSTIQSLQNLASGDYKNCHILVTTRIVGYNNELSGWQHYEVMSLKKENISQYAEDYFKKKNPPFLSALKKTPQMGPFSKNPLLLQILCFVFDKQKLVLPARRVELYKTAVREMLGLRKPEIPFPIKEKVLQEIAYCLLEGKEVFEEGDLREIIKGSLERAKEKYDVDDVLKEIVEKSGLLCRLSDDRYIFLHLTFQEYLCACHLTEREENPCQILEPVLFNARYREVITLTAGMLFKEKASRFIDFILSQKPLCYEVLHQPLLLAGMCIADILDDKADPSVEEKIRNELWRLWKKTELDPLRNEISRVFTSFAGTRNEEKIINSLLEVLKDKSKWVRGNAAEALGDLGRADDRVIDGLLGLLKDEDDFVHGRAAAALGKLGRADDRVIDGLLGLLKGKSVWACINADEALVNLGRADDRVIDGLLGLLKDEDEFVRSDAADALGNLGRADDRVIDTLLGLLKDEDDLARSDAARTLGKLGRADDRVIDELLGLLKDEDDFVRSDAAEALGKLGRA
ncbi:HEAT repeat domain-containing protein, partial [Candidatus Acetothermia bacterium]|nr:HEAT repeat domain-containing protein [Candidatus Acetothermia bacterium]